MQKPLRILLLSLAVLVFGPATASAVVHTGTIDGDEAQAATCSAGSTSRIVGTWAYDDVSGVFSWSYTYGDNAPAFDDGDLLGSPSSAHFHGPAAPGVGAGVRVGTTTVNPNVDSTTISTAFGAELLSELWYLNVHSSTCTGGELRGQLLVDAPAAVPSIHPPIALLMWGALVGLGTVVLRGRGANA